MGVLEIHIAEFKNNYGRSWYYRLDLHTTGKYTYQSDKHLTKNRLLLRLNIKLLYKLEPSFLNSCIQKNKVQTNCIQNKHY